MKCVKVLMLLGVFSGLAVRVSGQEGRREIERVEDEAARGRFWEYEILRDEGRQLHDAEAEAARQEQLKKSEHVRETMRRPPLPTQPPLGVGLQERLVIVQDKILRLREERSRAVEQGKPPEEIAAIDAKIERLKRESGALRQELGMAAE